MSPHQILSDRTLDRLCNDVLENMKSSGLYDEIRVKLMNDICDNEESFNDIVESFKVECARFCNQADLSENRNVLRNDMKNIDSRHARYATKLRSQLYQLLREQREDVKAKYYKHAGDYLRKKFLPQIQTSDDNNYSGNEQDTKNNPDSAMDVDMDIESSPTASSLSSIGSLPTPPPPPPTTTSTTKSETSGYKPPPPPPSGEPPQPMQISEPSESEKQIFPKSIDQELPPLPLSSPPPLPLTSPPDIPNDETNQLGTTELEENSPSQNKRSPSRAIEDLSDIEAPQFSPIGNSSPEKECIEEQPIKFNIEELTMSSVSSINTADLTDFDDSIKLSDDEASIVGKPKNSKVPLDEVKAHINDLRTGNVEESSSSSSKNVDKYVDNIENSLSNNSKQSDIQQQKSEDANASSTVTTNSTDEASGSESGKRTRKVNSRYSSEHFQL